MITDLPVGGSTVVAVGASTVVAVGGEEWLVAVPTGVEATTGHLWRR
jgi:hypothetical protein